MSYLMLCEHKKVKRKMVAFAFKSRRKPYHEQGFVYKNCCAACGCLVNKPLNDRYQGVKI